MRAGVGDLRDRCHLEHLGIDGRMVLKWIVKKLDWRWGVGWIDLAQDRDMADLSGRAV